MTTGAKVEGLDNVMANLNRHLRKRKDLTIAGLLAGGLIIQAESQRRTPVDTGNLKGSAFTRKSPEDANTVEVGHSAEYAIYVHENLNAYHDNGEAKFLENSVREKTPEVLQAVAEYGKKQ